ncbi:MAG: PIN domain-containing protein [Verrucomicrobia bacterium]|nr:PIN domain-containing protein [Verrucomicrobiota bacterium]
MIVPDINLLIYAYNLTAPAHAAARLWWEDLMTRGEEVGLPLNVALGFVRLMTNPKVIQPPMPLADALSEVKRWITASNVTLLYPTPLHWDVLEKIGWTGAAISDAHLAALAIEHNAELQTNDIDFSRCPGLRWKNPLAP